MPNRQEQTKRGGNPNFYNPKAKLDTSTFVDVRNNPKLKRKEELKSKLAMEWWKLKKGVSKLNPLD
jgi:hypothetical protein